MSKTLFEKIWEKHRVKSIPEGPDIIYIDKHFIHEVTSPQAFAGVEKRGLKVFRPNKTVATADHNVPTIDQHLPIKEELSRRQVQKLTENCKNHGVELYGLGHPFQGIVHIIGPELGITQPGMTIVCGDSHTSTHGAFGAVAFGIGSSEVEMVFASQCIMQTRPKVMRININGKLNKGVLSKDIILYIISKISASGATGYFVEYAGSTISDLSMEARMTICNMSIEMGARGGMIAPDETTFQYVKNRLFAPKGTAWDDKVAEWKKLRSDDDAVFDSELNINAEDIEPMITYGTNPGLGISINGTIPTSGSIEDEGDRKNLLKALEYMGLQEGQPLKGMRVQNVFIGSCTNSRIEDYRLIASFIKGKKKNENVKVMIVPGSHQVREQIVAEGLDKIFNESGFQIRQAGCSACLGMNEDKIPAGEYCISTSNRNFEGRQGPGARTLLASPLTAAVAAITGEVSDIREFV
ncbi:3-isopropylmalate dehydratase large subunit [Hanamia caeni]|jgi:3-isopropylmalate/(R)-2-methylmalate dehydratase large subunit|uniref:3-isopropylmalate dehydratase large subunit n=1 Tax=Hanamia caeni TaxID=2294116 RepID=A0A3M9NIY8_9BACT|nr:3-isopropylmalate dehydratase large subunit [Hanamia caeni]RNI37297.1 3-isopropylmalate dehydratase large subunit [Hanamia caeni]